MKFERERQRLEREKLEREKQELERLRRQQMSSRVVEDRRPGKRLAEDRDPYFDDRKRPQREREDYPASGSSRGMFNSNFSNSSPHGSSVLGVPVYDGATRRVDDWSSSGVGGRYDSGRSSRDVSGAGRGPPPTSSRDLGSSRGLSGSSRGLGSSRYSGGSSHMTSTREMGSSSYKGSSRDMLVSSGSANMGGSGYSGAARDMGGSGQLGHSSRGLSGGRDMVSSRDLGRPSGSDYSSSSRSRDDRGLGRSMHVSGGSHDIASHGSRSNTIGSHASGGSSWSSAMTGGSLAADWGRSGSDRGGVAGGLSSRAMTGMSGESAMAMGVGVGVNPFGGPALAANPFAGGSLGGGSMSGGGGGGSDRYDAYTLKNPLLGARRY